MAELEPGDISFAFATRPEFAAAQEEHDLWTSADGNEVLMWKPGTPLDRSAKSLQEFLDLAGPLLGRAVAAAKGR